MKFKRSLLSAIFVLSFLVLNITSCKNDKKNIKQTEVSFKKEGDLTLYKIATDSSQINLDIEISNTEYEIQTGLMYRDSLKQNQAMLFVFDDVRPRTFYMKKTRMPLDIIFFDETKKIVSFQKNAIPFDEKSLPSNAPVKYVLEINAGLIDAWSLTVGDSISYN